MNFTQNVATDVNGELVNEEIAQETEIEDERVAQCKQRQIGERGMYAHFVAQENEKRKHVANGAKDDPCQRKVLLQKLRE